MKYRLFFEAALATVRKWHADYDGEVRVWYEEGDGRAPDWCTEIIEGSEYRFNAGGLGHRFPYCIHGMSLTTDYDNICGGCEDSPTEIEQAQSLARSWWFTWLERCEYMRSAPNDLPEEVREGLAAWTLEALKPLEALGLVRS